MPNRVKQITWWQWIALIVGVIGVITHLFTIPILRDLSIWLVVIGLMIPVAKDLFLPPQTRTVALQVERRTKMNWSGVHFPKFGHRFVMIVIVVFVGLLIAGYPAPLVEHEIKMGMVVVFAIGALLVLLYAMAAGFYDHKLANARQPLGLPEGSIRALIALFLIMIFIIMSVYLFRTIAGRSGATLKNLTAAQVTNLGGQIFDVEQNQADNFDVILRVGVSEAGEQLALQLVTVLGTLVTAVSAFYFGSSSSKQRDAAAATSAKRALSVESINPVTAAATAGKVELVVTGTGFVDGAIVKLVKTDASDTIETTKAPVVNPLEITCTFDLTGKSGQWDVVVINPDKSEAKKLKAFQIT